MSVPHSNVWDLFISASTSMVKLGLESNMNGNIHHNPKKQLFKFTITIDIIFFLPYFCILEGFVSLTPLNFWKLSVTHYERIMRVMKDICDPVFDQRHEIFPALVIFPIWSAPILSIFSTVAAVAKKNNMFRSFHEASNSILTWRVNRVPDLLCDPPPQNSTCNYCTAIMTPLMACAHFFLTPCLISKTAAKMFRGQG